MLKINLSKKNKITILVFIATLLLVVILLFTWSFEKENISWGVTFSQEYAKNELDLDWQETYTAILDDLKVDHIRLSAYWNYYESENDYYNFSDLDWQIEEANKRDVKIILAVGRKLPRWPECHDPYWIKDLSPEETNQQLLQFIETTIRRYKNNPNIIYWQIENEPFLEFFGECPPLNKEFLQLEIALVKSLDNRPILITDSGELNWWINSSRVGGDILGTTLYRVVYNPWIGYWRWFLPPSFYNFKAQFAKLVSQTDKVIVAEAQTEAWHTENKKLSEMTTEEVNLSMSPKQFTKNINFSRRVGFDEIYLWGAEWWYFLKTQKDTPIYWDEAKKLWE